MDVATAPPLRDQVEQIVGPGCDKAQLRTRLIGATNEKDVGRDIHDVLETGGTS